MRKVRKTASVMLVALVLLMGYVTLTIPAIAATAPALLTLAFAFVAWWVWPRAG